MIKTIYNYDVNGEVTATGEFDADKYEEIPPNATIIEKPETGDNEVAIFNETDQGWLIKADYRNETYYDSLGNRHIIINIGVIPEIDWITEEEYFQENPPDPSEQEQRIIDLKNAVSDLGRGAAND